MIPPRPSRLVGRDREFQILDARLADTSAGAGSTIIIFGETGIGKTRLLDEFSDKAKTAGFRTLRGGCILESNTPFLPFKEALNSGGLGALLVDSPNPKLECLYLISKQGLLLGKAERASSTLDADVFTSMLRAVEDFVKDSMRVFSGEQVGDSLNSMGYGGYTILLQKGEACTLAAIISGQGNEFMLEDLRSTLKETQAKFGPILQSWNGVLDQVRGIDEPVRKLMASEKYEGIDFTKNDPRLKHNHMLENVTRGLVRESKSAPVCVILEDLQWADSSTLALVNYLTRNSKKEHILVVGTYRPEDLLPAPDGTEHPLQAFLSTMASENLMVRMELKRLGPEDVEALVKALLDPSNLPPELISRIASETDGNPMFVVEVTRLLVQEGAIYTDNGVWKAKDIDAYSIPSRVNEVVMRRVGRLNQEQKDILDCACVEGLEFTSTVLSLALDVPKLKLLKTLKELETAHNLIRSKKDSYLFDQTKVREVLYSQLGEELRREYHRLVAKAIEKVYEGKTDAVFESLALHYYEAGDTEKSLPMLVKAGDMARAKFANREAVEFYTKALKLMGMDPQYSGDSVTVHESLGDVQSVMGQFDRAIESFQAATAIVSTGKLGKGNRARLIAARMGRKASEVLEKKGDFVAADNGLGEALGALGDASHAEKGRILLDQGIVHWKRGDYDEARGHVFESLVELEIEKEDLKDISKAHNTLGLIFQSKGDYDRALEEFNKSLETDTKTGDMRSAITTKNNIGVVYWNKDDYDIAAKIFEDNLATIRKIGDPYALANTYNNLGLVHWNRGKNVEARGWHEKSLSIRERIGDMPGIAACYNNLGLVDWGLGEFDKALGNFQKCLAMREALGDRSGMAVCHNNIGNILADRSRYDEALDSYKKSLATMEALGDKQGIAISYNNLGDISFRLGKLNEAFDYHLKALELLKAIGDQQGVAVAYNNLGNLHIERGEYDKTLEYFEKSREIIEKIGDEKGLAVALNNLGDLWFYRKDMEKAEENYRKSMVYCEKTGDKRILVESLCGLAEISISRGELDRAHEHAEKAYDISKAIGLREDEGWSLRILGRLYGKQGKWNLCMEYLEKGVKLYSEIGLAVEEGDALLEIGQAYLDKGDKEKAEQCLRQAAEIFEKRGLKSKAELAHNTLERIMSPGASMER